MAQLLKQEYTNLKFKDGETVEDFSLRLQMLISKLKSHGVTIDEEETVSKYLHSVPAKYIQIALSIKTIRDLSTLTINDTLPDSASLPSALGTRQMPIYIRQSLYRVLHSIKGAR